MLSGSHPGYQGPKSKKCLQEEEAAQHDDGAEKGDERSVQAGGIHLAQSIHQRKGRTRRVAQTQPQSLPLRNIPQNVFSQQEEK